METLEITVTVEYENEIAEGSKQIAADLAAQAAANSIEESGGGLVTANGVIIHGSPGARSSKKSGKEGKG